MLVDESILQENMNRFEIDKNGVE